LILVKNELLSTMNSIFKSLKSIKNILTVKSEYSSKPEFTSKHFSSRSIDTGKSEGRSRFSSFLSEDVSSIFDRDIESSQKTKEKKPTEVKKKIDEVNPYTFEKKTVQSKKTLPERKVKIEINIKKNSNRAF